MKKLEETVAGMLSPDYRERFVAEYWQTKIRYQKLHDMINKIELWEDEGYTKIKEPKHDCPKGLLEDQAYAMGCYLKALEKRAIVEHIDFDHPDTIDIPW